MGLNKNLKHCQDNIPDFIPQQNNTNKSVSNSQNIQVVMSNTSNIPKNNRNPKKSIPVISYLQMEEFQSIPKYQKGRITYAMINHFVDEINKVITAKYSLLTIPKKDLTQNVRDKILMYKNQHNKETKGLHFIVDNDIKEHSKLKVDKQLMNMMSILRCCKRIREIRGDGITRYVIC